MAVQVLAAADRRRARASGEVAQACDDGVRETATLTQYARRSGGFEPVVTAVGIGERPPAASC